MIVDFVVPGKRRTRIDSNDKQIRSGVIPSGYFDTPEKGNKNDLLMPSIRATLKEGGSLEVDILATFFRKWAINETQDIHLNYQIGLSLGGEYQLQIYLYSEKITFDDDPSDLNRDVYCFRRIFTEGDIELKEGLLCNGYTHSFYDFAFTTAPKVNINQIKSVVVFIINTNPETSRGTETTVQQGGG